MHQPVNEWGYPLAMNMEIFDDNPDLTEIRATRHTDVAVLESIEVKCHESPMDRAALAELIKTPEVHGILGVRSFQNAGYALFNVQEDGHVVYINRMSVAVAYLEKGVAEKLIETLRTTLPDGPPPVLRMMVSEHSINEPFFNKLLSLGFRSTGLAPKSVQDYSRNFGTIILCDGIKLELA